MRFGTNDEVEGTSLPAAGAAVRRTPKRLLALRGDDHLVARVRAGDEGAFEVAYERHAASILSFCRHMLSDAQEAEDAVQQVFLSAHRDLLRDEREIRLKPWLYAIARNRCLSILRARRERADGDPELLTAGLADEVQHRADLRELVADLHDLPEDQRAALVLTEIGDLSHAEVAEVLGRGTANVKGLVFRARSGLIERRDARDAPCEEIRVELANARHGALRRGRLRHHLTACPGCSAYLEDVRRQRRMMALVLPVVPSIGLKRSVLAGVMGGGGGSAAGGGGLAATGLGAALPATGGLAAKVAVVGVLAGSAGVAGEAALDDRQPPPRAGQPSAAAPADPAAATPVRANEQSQGPAESGDRPSSAPGDRARANDRRRGLRSRGGQGPAAAAPPGRSNERAALRRRNAAAPALGRREAIPVKEPSRRPTTPTRAGKRVAGDPPKRAQPPARSERRPEPAEPTRGP